MSKNPLIFYQQKKMKNVLISS